MSQGSLRLFRFAGIDLYLHWSWFLVAYYEISQRTARYSSLTWNVLEYLGLFLIVLLHEFGHSLACRQVGGRADHIVLWPLGGVAYVQPPPRPGANLWSVSAGPLVNVVLIPVLLLLGTLAQASGLAQTAPDVFHLLRALMDSATDPLGTQLENAGLSGYFDQALSVDLIRRFTPHGDAYRMAADRLGLRTADLRLVSAHAWDIAGALRAGGAAAFVGRPGKVLDPRAEEPDVTGNDLHAVAQQILEVELGVHAT